MGFLRFIPQAVIVLWGIGSDYLNYRRELSRVKQDIKIETIKSTQELRLTKALDSYGWKDDFWTIILAVPAVMVMLAPIVDLIMFHEVYKQGDFMASVVQGLKALEYIPDWYAGLLITAVSASFGLKGYNIYNRKQTAIQALKDLGVKVVGGKTNAKPEGGDWPSLKK